MFLRPPERPPQTKHHPISEVFPEHSSVQVSPASHPASVPVDPSVHSVPSASPASDQQTVAETADLPVSLHPSTPLPAGQDSVDP